MKIYSTEERLVPGPRHALAAAVDLVMFLT